MSDLVVEAKDSTVDIIQKVNEALYEQGYGIQFIQDEIGFRLIRSVKLETL